MKPGLQVSGSCQRAIRDHAARLFPSECCGTLLGSERENGWRQIHRALPAPNRAGDRFHAYELDPAALLHAERAARAAGLEICGIYHSHPNGIGHPSERDRLLATPDWSYIIVTAGGLRSFRCSPAGIFKEEPVCRFDTESE